MQNDTQCIEKNGEISLFDIIYLFSSVKRLLIILFFIVFAVSMAYFHYWLPVQVELETYISSPFLLNQLGERQVLTSTEDLQLIINHQLNNIKKKFPANELSLLIEHVTSKELKSLSPSFNPASFFLSLQGSVNHQNAMKEILLNTTREIQNQFEEKIKVKKQSYQNQLREKHQQLLYWERKKNIPTGNEVVYTEVDKIVYAIQNTIIEIEHDLQNLNDGHISPLTTTRLPTSTLLGKIILSFTMALLFSLVSTTLVLCYKQYVIYLVNKK